jgi:hypothetical protein
VKKLILPIFIVFILTNSCKKDANLTAIDGCAVSAYVNTNYLTDAQEIVYRRILSGAQVQGSGQPEFNQDELDRVLSAFESIYALHTPTSDSMFTTLKIHTYKVYLLNSMIFKVNMSTPEIKSLITNHTTGNATFDGLMTQYGFSYDGKYPPVTDLPFATFNSANWYNMNGLLPLFSKFPFVSLGQSNGTVGDGNDITYQINGNVRTVEFSIGFGDCPAGCGGRKRWQFTVDANCKARFVKIY